MILRQQRREVVIADPNSLQRVPIGLRGTATDVKPTAEDDATIHPPKELSIVPRNQCHCTLSSSRPMAAHSNPVNCSTSTRHFV